jgi:hypothetical protein
MFVRLPLLLKNLKNLWYCKIHELNNKLVYPNCILPKLNYKQILTFDEITKKQGLLLLRRSELCFEDTFFKLGDKYLLKDDAISLKRIPNLSTNLLGGHFEPKHSSFRVNLYTLASEKWNGSIVYLSEHLNSYSKVEEGCVIYLNANNIHSTVFPYNLKSNVSHHKEIENFQEIFKDNILKNEMGEVIELKGSACISHEPINLNYWHVEVNIKDYKGGIITEVKNSQSKQFAQEALINLIKVNSFADVDKINQIPIEFYKIN